MRPALKLSGAVAMFRYRFRVHAAPWRIKGALGQPTSGADAVMLPGRVIACRADSWEYAYAVSHEMAEHVWGYQHSEQMFAQQANILATMARHLALGKGLPLGEWYTWA